MITSLAFWIDYYLLVYLFFTSDIARVIFVVIMSEVQDAWEYLQETRVES